MTEAFATSAGLDIVTCKSGLTEFTDSKLLEKQTKYFSRYELLGQHN